MLFRSSSSYLQLISLPISTCMLSPCAVSEPEEEFLRGCDFVETVVFALVDSTFRHGEDLSKICVYHIFLSNCVYLCSRLRVC